MNAAELVAFCVRHNRTDMRQMLMDEAGVWIRCVHAFESIYEKSICVTHQHIVVYPYASHFCWNCIESALLY
jgi:hypothetical protein